MRAFAFLSLAAAALAAPAAFIPGGSVVNAVAPITAPVGVVAGAVANVEGYVSASAANVDANYNQVANNDLNDNKIKIARSVNVQKVGVNKTPVNVNANYPQVNALSDVHQRGVAAVYAPLILILKALVALAAQFNVNAIASIANVGLNYNNILNGVANNNNISVLSARAAANILTDILVAIFAVIKACVSANVPVDAIVGNVTATANQIGNNVGNGNNVVVARGLLTAVAPLTAVITAVIPILARVCADVTAEILNISLNYNQIANNLLNGNSIHIL